MLSLIVKPQGEHALAESRSALQPEVKKNKQAGVTARFTRPRPRRRPAGDTKDRGPPWRPARRPAAAPRPRARGAQPGAPPFERGTFKRRVPSPP